MIELKLCIDTEKLFDEVYPYQLFQASTSNEIWVKVSQKYARTIPGQVSTGRQFQPTEKVKILMPESTQEEQ